MQDRHSQLSQTELSQSENELDWNLVLNMDNRVRIAMNSAFEIDLTMVHAVLQTGYIVAIKPACIMLFLSHSDGPEYGAGSAISG